MAAEQETQIGLGDSLADDDAGEEESTPRATKSKRKRTEPRDPNAPKRPCSAYIYFSTEMRLKLREEKSSMNMAERSKYIGKLWAALSLDNKKKYQEMSEKDKQRYIQEYVAYQETDTYKKYMRSKHPALKKARQEDKESTSASVEKPEKAPAKMPLSCQQQFIPGSNVPIFSDQFLKHNRDLETQLRKLRQSSANLEEENALLSRHVESMKMAVERVQNEVRRQEEKNDQTQSHLNTVREVLAVAFKDIAIPETNETPTFNSVDDYIGKLQQTLSVEPDKHPALVERVGIIAKQLETVLKAKLAHGMVEAILERNTGERREEEGGIQKASAVTEETEAMLT